jgi:LmbE family N-acetylglucosaminyl deacetylase
LSSWTQDVAVLAAPPRGPVLCFAPHADDEVLGAGGTLALHRDQGDPVAVAVVFDGRLGLPVGLPADTRRREAQAAAQVLGLAPYEFLDYPEGHEPTAPQLAEGVERLARVIRAVAPRTIYGPWVGEAHPDHRLLARVLGLAWRAAGRDAELWGYEVWTPLEAQRLVEVSAVWPRKLEALSRYGSQDGGGALRELAEQRGALRTALLRGPHSRGEAFVRFLEHAP